MNEVPYTILYSTISLIIGGFLGLTYSYKKYNMPYVEKVRDKYVLICSMIGGLMFLIDLPYHVNYPIACLLIGVPFGMRPGYGNVELYVGLIVIFLGYLIKKICY